MSEASQPEPASHAPGSNGAPPGASGTSLQAPQWPPSPDVPARSKSPWLRPKRVLLIVIGVIVFLAISTALARWLSVENLERDEDLRVLQAEARGDPAGMARLLSGCRERSSCLARMRQIDADPRVRRPGSVKILDLESNTAYSIGSSTGPSRVAWTVIGTLPVIQCFRIKRTGNILTGIKLQLLSISPPIQNEADC